MSSHSTLQSCVALAAYAAKEDPCHAALASDSIIVIYRGMMSAKMAAKNIVFFFVDFGTRGGLPVLFVPLR